MDERDRVLRVISTDSHLRWTNVYCLDESLKLVGDLRAIAPRGLIHSVRYTSSRVYMVTFQKKPLIFIINLTDHTSPTLLGHLKADFRSLHLYDESTVIGFSTQTAEHGIQLGLKLVLLNVSDVG